MKLAYANNHKGQLCWFFVINIVNWKLRLLLFIGLSQNFKAKTSFEVGPKVKKKSTAKPLMFYLQVCWPNPSALFDKW